MQTWCDPIMRDVSAAYSSPPFAVPTPSASTSALSHSMLHVRVSSGLWPFATVGWPQEEGLEHSALQKFYPAAVLETGYDIIFFWVAR